MYTPGKYFKNLNIVGPGKYETSLAQGFEGIQNSVSLAKQLEKLGLNRYGIQVVKPSSQFTSKKSRFDVKSLTPEPGPGTYLMPKKVQIKQKPKV